MAFPIVMYGCESWTIKKAECRRTDAFVLWCWRTLESLLDCKEIKPVNPKGINPEYSLEGLMLKLKLQYFGCLMRRTYSFERPWFCERFKEGGEGDNRGWDGWMASLTQWSWIWMSSGRCWRTGKPGVLQSMGSQRVGHNQATELQHHVRQGADHFALNSLCRLFVQW